MRNLNRLSFVVGLVAGIAVTGCGQGAKAPATSDVWAVVDGHEIRKDEVDKAYRRVAPQNPQTGSADEELGAKLGLVDELITQHVLLGRARALKLDMTRGKPSSEQLDLSNAILTILTASDFMAADGTDTRNYGGLDGIPEMKAIFAEMLETSAANVVVGGNSSLQMMHDTVLRALWHGVPGGTGPWTLNGPRRDARARRAGPPAAAG